jgi:hypothetical protein
MHSKKYLLLKIQPKNIQINEDGFVKLTHLSSCLNIDKFDVEVFNLKNVTNYTAPELLYL